LKLKISEKEALDSTLIKLMFGDKELTDDQRLESVKLMAGSNTVALTIKERIELEIKTTQGASAADMVCSNDVLEVKKKMSSQMGADHKFVKLTFNGDEIKDDEKLRAIKNQTGSNEFGLVAKERMLINVIMMKGNVVNLDLETTDSILDVKKQLNRKEGINKALLKLLYKDFEFTDEMSLQDVKAKACSNQVNLLARERMHMNVQMMSGENVPYEMETIDDVQTVKSKIQDKTGLESRLIKLNFSEEEVNDD